MWVEGWYATNPIVDLKNLKSRHRSAIMASGFFLSAANQAFVSALVNELRYQSERADESGFLRVSFLVCLTLRRVEN